MLFLLALLRHSEVSSKTSTRYWGKLLSNRQQESGNQWLVPVVPQAIHQDAHFGQLCWTQNYISIVHGQWGAGGAYYTQKSR